MAADRILITGASGCVGQYLASWLMNNSDAELLLALRDPEKIKSIDLTNPRIELLVGDLRNIELFGNQLQTVNQVIHTATAWGDPKRAYEVNILAVKKLLNLLDPLKIKQIIYFSTASILKKNLDPLPEALSFGTEYIQTKASCLEQLENSSFSKKIIAVFPTLVFGGRVDGESLFPTSYLTNGLKEATNWLWLARWFKAYSLFHFIHAADIAFICGHLATTDQASKILVSTNGIKKLVLGQPSLSIDQAIAILLKWKGMIRTPSIPLSNWLVKALIRFLPIKLTSWDKFSIKQRHFVHEPITNPESFGGISHAKTLKEILTSSGLPKKI